MNASPPLNRRQFLQTTTLATAAWPFLSTGAEPPTPRAGKPKVGCLSWCFHDFSPGVDPEPAIDLIGQMGFDGIELIVTASRDLQGFWTDARLDRYRRKLDGYKLRVSQFVLFQPVVGGLSSLEADIRNRSLDHFEAGCRLGQKLDAVVINIVAPWTLAMTGPTDYLPRYYEISNPKPGEKFHFDIAPGFDFDEVWGRYVQTMQECVARAKAHGLKFTIEQHTHTLVPTTDAFRRLWDAIRDPALGYNLDAGWTLLEREYPPMAVHKVSRQLMNLHLRDIDGRMRRFPPIGQGVMDFQAIVTALKRIGFDGYASLEQDKNPGDPPMRETVQHYLRMMREYIG
ncbi:MAG: sugar phosphate isomerase/epimerase [Verrucomicrobia bacterium]|nr:sugar phosphate isomerase/epimerase [Verrucomicrobiota bacterium]